jgi:hypothetical protein
MKSIIQLYIDGQRVDLFKDESVVITQMLKNSRDISKIFTDFSKTFTVPASANNNKIFKHYYNTTVQGGFDGRKKVDAVIELNNLPFKTGSIKLSGVDLRLNKAQNYKITFIGKTVKLKTILGEDKLESLDGLNAYSRPYSYNSIKSGMEADPDSDEIITPLISHTSRLVYDTNFPNIVDDVKDPNFYRNVAYAANEEVGVYWNDLKYAIRVDTILDEIKSKYPELNFSNDFFNSTNKPYYNLFMWLHRKAGGIATTTPQTLVDNYSVSGDDYGGLISDSVIRIPQSIADKPCTIAVELETNSVAVYDLVVLKDGEEYFRKSNLAGDNVVNISNDDIQAGDYSLIIESNNNFSFVKIEFNLIYLDGITLKSVDYTSLSFSISNTIDFIMTQEIPEMKIIDFITGLFKMFNLIAYIDDVTNELIVKTLDDYYSTGNSYDITKYVDISKSSVNVALPFREINFKHGDTKTILADQHQQLKNYQWSEERYASEQKLDGGVYKVETPFSIMKYERLEDVADSRDTTVQYGLSVNKDNSPYKGKPLLFYPILQDSTRTTEIAIIDDSNAARRRASYIVPSNSVSLSAYYSLDSLHFYNEFNEYSRTQSFTNTLFNKYYSDYISNVFNPLNRLTKLSAFLPIQILSKLTLADRLDINGLRYKIDGIKTNLLTGKSDLDLITDYGTSVFSDNLNDTIAPTLPSNFSYIVENSNTSVNLSWDRSEDDGSGVEYYSIYLDGVFLRDVLHTSSQYTQSADIKNLTPSTSYVIKLTATDVSGNTSAQTSNFNIVTIA